MKLVHWPLMGGLLHLVQRGDWAGHSIVLKLLTDMKHRAASLWQQGYLSMLTLQSKEEQGSQTAHRR